MSTAKPRSPESPRIVERVQTGVRLEKRLLKVLKGLAEYLDLSLGDLLEGIALWRTSRRSRPRRSKRLPICGGSTRSIYARRTVTNCGSARPQPVAARPAGGLTVSGPRRSPVLAGHLLWQACRSTCATAWGSCACQSASRHAQPDALLACGPGWPVCYVGRPAGCQGSAALCVETVISTARASAHILWVGYRRRDNARSNPTVVA